MRTWLDRNKVVIDLFGAIGTIAAFVALAYSAQSAKSATESTEAARESVKLQEAGLQPIFLAYQDVEESSHNTSVIIARVVSPSGTFLDVRATARPFIVLGRGAPTEAAPMPVVRDGVIIPDEMIELGPGQDPKKRGVLIESWMQDQPASDWWHIWQETAGEEATTTYSIIVEVNYRDVLRNDHTRYFKLGGQPVRYGKNPTAEIAEELKGETLDPDHGQRCIALHDRLLREAPDYYKGMNPLGADKETVRRLYDTYREKTNESAWKECG